MFRDCREMVSKGFFGIFVLLVCHDVSAAADYFPLAVGTKWTYRCSVEGAFQFNKTLRIVSMKSNPKGDVTYRGEWKVGKEKKPLVVNYDVSPDGRVESFYDVDPGAREVLMVSSPAIGTTVGSLKVVGQSVVNRNKFKNVRALRLENFALDAQTDAVKRSTWVGRVHGENIGILEDSDGTGASCVLSSMDK